MRALSMIAGLIALTACAPASAPGGAGPAADLEFRCSAASQMAASQGSTRVDARLRAFDTRRDCIDAGTQPQGGARGM